MWDPRKRGLPNLYPVVAIALVGAFGAAVWSGEKWAPPSVSVAAWLALLVAIAAYGLEVRRDPSTAARLALVVTLFVAIFGGGGAVAETTPFASPVLAVVLYAVPAVVVIAWAVWMQWGREPYPNPIRSKFGTHAGEERGVQMAVAAPDLVRTGEVGQLDVYLQNTWDSPRTASVTVNVIGYARSSAPPAIEVALEPLATVVVRVPFVVEESESPWVDVWAAIAVDGTGGRRRRLWRAPWRAGRPRRAFTGTQAAALARGTGGGIPSRVSVAGAPAGAPPLPLVSSRTVWSLLGSSASMVRE
jgi:hypothetical protein